ncbi:MAG: hypothetical protein KDC84_15715 [Crocinitomicaceae bacterium]|nr:hypothetical protein [Crocinitomicaceae bacterium]
MLEQIEEIRLLISKGFPEEAIELLSSMVKDRTPMLRNQVLLLSSKLGYQNRNRRIGIDVDQQEIQQVNLGILEILDELEQGLREKMRNLKVELQDEASKPIKKNKWDDKKIRPLLEVIRNTIIENLLDEKIEITKIRATIIDDNFQYWEMILSDQGKHSFDKDETIPRILYRFHKNELNVLNFIWNIGKIHFHTYIKDHQIGYFELKY